MVEVGTLVQRVYLPGILSVHPRADAERRARVLTPLGDLLHPGIFTEHSEI